MDHTHDLKSQLRNFRVTKNILTNITVAMIIQGHKLQNP